MLLKTLSAKRIAQNVRIEVLAETVFEKIYHWKWPRWKTAQKTTRKNSCSKCPYQNFSWISVRKTITEKDRTGMLPKMYPQKQSFKISLPDC